MNLSNIMDSVLKFKLHKYVWWWYPCPPSYITRYSRKIQAVLSPQGGLQRQAWRLTCLFEETLLIGKSKNDSSIAGNLPSTFRSWNKSYTNVETVNRKSFTVQTNTTKCFTQLSADSVLLGFSSKILTQGECKCARVSPVWKGDRGQ